MAPFAVLGDLRVLRREMARWLERGTLLMSLPAVRFRTPLGARFSEKYRVSPISIVEYYFDFVSLGKALNHQMPHLTQLKTSRGEHP